MDYDPNVAILLILYLWPLTIFHLSPVHALRIFIAMQVQHSYNSSTNGWILLTHVLSNTFRYGCQNKNLVDKSRTHDFRVCRLPTRPLGRTNKTSDPEKFNPDSACSLVYGLYHTISPRRPSGLVGNLHTC